MSPQETLTPSELCVLTLLVEGPRHGWGLATTLAQNGEVGSIWSVARPLVYTGLRELDAQGQIKIVGLERGDRGPHRVIYQATAKGKKTVSKWLADPVEHVRDIRSLFLLKVVLNQRLGLDPEPLLVAQRALMAPFIGWLESRLDDVDPIEDPAEETVLYFRLETAQTTVRFIDHVLDQTKASKRRAARKRV
ncbi:MAG TPA: PadR family transcriptional regulator [Gaiellaceae bacterium]|jgi:DNA-binding PadR family transcriptional regulator